MTIFDGGVGSGTGDGAFVHDIGAGTSVTSVRSAGCVDCAGAGVDGEAVGAGDGVENVVRAGDGVDDDGVGACAGAGFACAVTGAADDCVGAGAGSGFDDAEAGVEAATYAGPSVIESAAICTLSVHVLPLGPGSDG